MISFIIPVYNTGIYIRECLDSILEQKLLNYEIIIINDGSTDNSLSICNEYASNHDNIYVFCQNNSGPSAARNNGLMKSKGEYVFFLDSDDYYVQGSLDKFGKIIELKNEVDLIFGKIMTFYENSDKKNSKIKYKNTSEICSKTGEEALNYLVKTNQVMISNYSALIKRSLLVENNIIFKENISFAEDVDFMLRVYCASKNTQFIDDYFLMYRKNREGQLTQNIHLKKLKVAVELYEELIFELDNWGIEEYSKKLIKRYLSNLYFSSIGSLKKVDSEYHLKYDLLKKYKHLVKYTGGKRFIFNKWVYFIFGFKTSVRVMWCIKGIYNKIKV